MVRRKITLIYGDYCMNKDLGKALGILANPVICSRLNHPCYLSVYMGESE